MCDEVVRVEDALYDVRDMLKDAQRAKSVANGADAWRREFTKVVQDVVQKDAGWECVFAIHHPA